MSVEVPQTMQDESTSVKEYRVISKLFVRAIRSIEFEKISVVLLKMDGSRVCFYY